MKDKIKSFFLTLSDARNYVFIGVAVIFALWFIKPYLYDDVKIWWQKHKDIAAVDLRLQDLNNKLQVSESERKKNEDLVKTNEVAINKLLQDKQRIQRELDKLKQAPIIATIDDARKVWKERYANSK